MQSWSFGILCFNERGSLQRVFDQVQELVSQWHLEDYEILLVDDGSTDGTREMITDLAVHDVRIRPILHPRNKGIGAGIRSIYFNARKENVVFIPGDGQFDVAELRPYPDIPEDQFLAFFREENQTYSTFRNALSWLNKWYNRFFLGLDLRDVNWVKVYKTAIITRLHLRLHSSAIESEICAKLAADGIQAREIQSRYLPRRYGVSKGASWRSILRVLRELIKLCVAVNTYRFRLSSKKSA